MIREGICDHMKYFSSTRPYDRNPHRRVWRQGMISQLIVSYQRRRLDAKSCDVLDVASMWPHYHTPQAQRYGSRRGCIPGHSRRHNRT
jgi:hypothetical protein